MAHSRKTVQNAKLTHFKLSGEVRLPSMHENLAIFNISDAKSNF